MSERTQRLRQLMSEHGLSAKQTATLIGRTAQTVRIWCVQTPNSREIPEQLLELLELKLSRPA